MKADSYKERRIGHEVFGREVGYDTAADPVVRNAASETRKRLRQYEAESGADEQVHIQLAPGAYLLDFRFSEPGPLPGHAIGSRCAGHSLFRRTGKPPKIKKNISALPHPSPEVSGWPTASRSWRSYVV